MGHSVEGRQGFGVCDSTDSCMSIFLSILVQTAAFGDILDCWNRLGYLGGNLGQSGLAWDFKGCRVSPLVFIAFGTESSESSISALEGKLD